MEGKYPARLHVVLANSSPDAVVFRRGPSKEVCTLHWDRKNDTFEVGQWLKGRIYERRSDLSPNGKHLIYFAMNGKWDSETFGSWTAISQAPWLKAIELYGKGDCWDGGGLFITNNTFWLNDRYFDPAKTLQESSAVQRDDKYQPEGEFGAEDTGVYYRRLLRDGWNLIRQEADSDIVSNSLTVFEKALINGWVLRKIAHEQVGAPKGKGCFWDEHEVINQSSGIYTKHKDWEWAELDNKTIVWAEKGCIYRSKITSSTKIEKPKMLYDFNSLKFEEITAPY